MALCKDCNGTGKAGAITLDSEGDYYIECPSCGGTGDQADINT